MLINVIKKKKFKNVNTNYTTFLLPQKRTFLPPRFSLPNFLAAFNPLRGVLLNSRPWLSVCQSVSLVVVFYAIWPIYKGFEAIDKNVWA